MNKIEILKLVNNYLDTQNVIYANSIYQEMKVRRRVTRSTAALRTITDAEIIVEFDTENKTRSYVLFRKIIKKLKANKISYVVWKAENQRSPHIHIYDIIGLDKLEPRLNRMYKKIWFKKFANWDEADDGINTKETNLIVMEDAIHFKYNTRKELITSNINNKSLSNIMNIKILEEARREIQKLDENKKKSRDNDFCNRWFIKWVTTEKLPKGERHSTILKNLAIAVVNENYSQLGIDQTTLKLYELYGSAVVSDFKNWIKWVEQGHNDFGIYEIIRFCYKYNIDFYRVKDKYTKMYGINKNRCRINVTRNSGG